MQNYRLGRQSRIGLSPRTLDFLGYAVACDISPIQYTMPKMSNKVKVLYIITESEWAGASRYVYDLATHLTRDDAAARGGYMDGGATATEHFEIAVAGAGKGDILTMLGELGIKTVYLKWLARTIHLLKDFLAFWEILFLYFRERPDIIHLNSSKAGFLGTLAAAFYKVVIRISRILTTYYLLPTTVFTAHGWVFNEPGRTNWFFHFLERLASRFRDTIICVSENDRQEALRWRITPAAKLITIHNGIDPKTMRFLDRETARRKLANYELRITNQESGRGCEFNAKLIGTIANLYPNKGLEHLIEALHLIKRQSLIPDSGFLIRSAIIGSGPLRPELEAQIKKYGLEERVFLVGRVHKAWKYLRTFDCFVLASVKEGLPYAILEALAAGIPVVAANVGGIPEIAQEAPIRLVPPKNPQALAQTIIETLNKKPSNPSTFPSEFTLQTMVKRTLEVYRKPRV